jgi:zinc-binding alcohol dehydrogenase/oxidoreductase
MKAAVLYNIKEPLRVTNTDKPVITENEVLVKLKAAALNHRDVWVQKGLYAGIKLPVILGSDGTGIVEACGTGVNQKWTGKEVIINPSLNWGNDTKAQQKSFMILGLPENGTFAEYVKVEAGYIYPKPPHLSFTEAAALPLAGLTAYRALFTRAHLQKDERVLVTGIGGGVALFVLQFAIAAGAEVYVTSGSDNKIDKAITLGAIKGVNYKNPYWVKQLQETTDGFDVIVDGAAGEGFLQLPELTKPGGRIVNYGATQGDVPKLNMRRIFWKQLNVLGSTMGSAEDFSNMIDFVNEKKIKPVIDKVFDLDDAEQALQRMANAEQFGKIVLKMDQ